MLSYLLHCYSFFGGIGEHPVNEILELLAVESWCFALGVGTPEGDEVLLFDEAVVGVIGCCFLEWRGTCVHYEEDHSSRKDIDFSAVVALSLDLGRHIPLRTQFGAHVARSVLPLQSPCETKVGDLQYKIVREQNILRFDIPMSVTLLMHVVQSVQHLLEVGSGDIGEEPSPESNVVE